MKIARILLLAALLLSAFSSTALASDQAIGFVRLVAVPDTGTPMAVQTQQAFHRLLPRLLAAKAAGQIISFEPSLDLGILQFSYRPSAGVPDLAGKAVFSDLQQAAPASSLPPEGGGCLSPGFWLNLYSAYFSANCLAPGAHIVGSLRDATGRAVALYNGTTDGTGAIIVGAFGTWTGPMWHVNPGYTVTFKEYTGTTLIATFKVKAPTIKITSIARATSIVQGTGPAGKTATLRWSHDRLDATDSTLEVTKVRTISSAGTWKVDFGMVPLRGDDYLGLYVAVNANFTFSTGMFVPATYCVLGGNYCEIYGFPRTPASLQIVHGGSTYNFSGKFDSGGTFSAELLNSSGAPVYLVAYDKVSGAGVAQYGLPKLTANINYTTDSVSGKAPPYKYLKVWVYVANAASWPQVYAHSNSSGIYTANFMTTHGLDLVAGDSYTAETFYTNPASGNMTDYFVVYGP